MNLFNASSTASSMALASLVHELVQCLFLHCPQNEEQLVPSAENAQPIVFLMLIHQKLLVFSDSNRNWGTEFTLSQSTSPRIVNGSYLSFDI